MKAWVDTFTIHTPTICDPMSPSLEKRLSTQAAKFELVSLEEAEVASCGSKAAACGRLLQLAQASGGLFQAPQGAVIPFGIMNLALKVRGCCSTFTLVQTDLHTPIVCFSREARGPGLKPPSRQLQRQGCSCWQASSCDPGWRMLQVSAQFGQSLWHARAGQHKNNCCYHMCLPC